ncbi:hypothetical protein ACHAPJ_009928 [Fusarium lateritium]
MAILPTELVVMIASHMDIISFHHFRQVSRYTRAVATKIPEYQQVLQHGPEGIDALLQTGLGNEYSYKSLYNVLVTPNCELCGSFGGLLFLPTCTRCCYNCLKTAPELAILEKRHIDLWYPRMLRGPEGYQLAGISEALKSTKIRSVSIHEMSTPIGDEWVRIKLAAVLASDVFKAYRKCGDIDEEAVKVLEKAYLHLRSKSCTRYPWLDLKTTTTERGVSCKGCHAACGLYPRLLSWPYIPEDPHDRDRAFSKHGFQAHFESCGYAQQLWKNSDGGTRAIKDDMFVERGGCYLNHDYMEYYKGFHLSGWMTSNTWLGDDEMDKIYMALVGEQV